MATVASVAISLIAKTARFNKNIGKSKKIMADFGRTTRRLAKAVSGVTVGAFGLLVKSSLSTIDALAKTSDQMGITTQKLATMNLAAKLTGSSIGGFRKGIIAMQRRISEATEGTGEAVEAFKKLGLSASDLISKTPIEQFAAIGEALRGVANQADLSAVKFDIFGRSGVEMTNLLALTNVELANIETFADRAGLSVSRIEAKAVESANDAFTLLGASVKGLSNTLTIKLAPIFKEIADTLTGVTLRIKNMSAETASSILRYAKLTAGVFAAGAALRAVRGIIALVTASIRVLSKALAISQALSGPKGWLALAGGIAIATGAVIAVDTAFDSAGTAIVRAQQEGAKFNATLSGITRQANRASRSLEKVVDFSKLKTADGGVIADLIQKVRDFNRSDLQILSAKLSKLGVSDTFIELAIDAQKQLTALEGLRDLADIGRDVFSDTRTPAEQLNIKIGELNDLLAAGSITADTFGRALAQAKTNFDRLSSRSLSATVRVRTARELGGASGVAVSPLLARQNKVQVEQLEELRKMNRKLVMLQASVGFA